MTISLMSLLGGSINLSAASGNEDSSDVVVSSNGDAAFDTIMAATKMQEISAEKLKAFFAAHGAKIPAALGNGQSSSAGQVLAQILAAQDGKKMPGDMVVALQELLPQEMAVAVEQTLAHMLAEDGEVLAELPQRELTPEELSKLVQETGLPPVVIFAALQETRAASPNLAYAMVDDMGAAEADANLPLPRGAVAQQVLATNNAAAPKSSDAQQTAQVASQIASVDFSVMDESKRDVLKRIVDVLRGNKTQGEFDWNSAAKPVAANGNEKAAEAAVKAAQPVSTPPYVPTGGQSTDMALNAQGAAAKGVAQGAQQQAGNALSKPDMSQHTTPSTQAADAPQQNFAATLEQSSSLRGPATADAMHAQMRHTPSGTPAEQVTVHIGKMLADGTSKMDIHLKPAELGRVDIRIETDAAGKSHVTVTADKRDTLDMLQRDARGLEKALADAGLKADSNSLSFNLRGGEGQQHAQQQGREGQGKPAFDMNGNYAELDEKLGESEMALTYDIGRTYRLNIDSGIDISV